MVEISAVAAAKQHLRATARRIRSDLSEQFRLAASEAIAAHGIGFAGLPPGAVVAGFMPIGAEIDPLPLMLRLAGMGHDLALPAMQGESAPLRFQRWRPGDPLAEKAWGIREPLPAAPDVAPDAMLVPLLAFDAEGHRLGYGGGYYDRSLSAARRARAVVAIGLAYDAQEVPAVPRLDFDQRLDWVLTPSGPRKCV